MPNLTQSTVSRLKSIKHLFPAVLILSLFCMSGFNAGAQDKLAFGTNETLEEIQAKIQHNGYSFEVGHNWVFDLTPEEKARMFPARRAPAPGNNIPTPNTDIILNQRISPLPSKLDWRNVDGHSYIGPIRNQGKSCACVTFGCTDAASLSYNVTNGLYDQNCAAFSVMYFLWTLGPSGYYDGFGYAGGDAEYQQFYALMKTGGPKGAAGFEGAISEADFPFVDNMESPPPDVIERSKTYPRVTFKNWSRVMPVNYADTTEQIKVAIAAHGSVAVQIDITDAFLAYKSGVFQDTNTLPDVIPYYDSGTTHGVSLVGWDDNPPEGGGGCWILRNEWGTGWGENGYMRIRYFSAQVNTAAAYVVAGASAAGKYAIRGTVSGPVISGVTLSLSDSDTSSVTPDKNGRYALGDLAAGTYTVTPSYPGCSFVPSSGTVTLPFENGDFTGCDFISWESGPFLAITVSPDNKGNTYPPVGQAPFQEGQSTLLYAKTADVCYDFQEWNIVGDAKLKADKTVAVNEITLSGNASATAVFKYIGPPDHVDLEMTYGSGHEAGTFTPSQGIHPVKYNEPVSINAIPSEGYFFSSWNVKGKATIKDPCQPETTVILTGDATICSYFYRIAKEVTFSISAFPVDSGFTNPFPGFYTVPGGVSIPIEAIPSDGYYFDKWTSNTGNGVKFDNVYSCKTQAVFLRFSAEVLANFKKIDKTASLTLAVSPDNSGTTNPVIGAYTVPVGAHTAIEALPADGYFFVNWTVAGSAQVDDPYSDKTLVVLSENATVTANFAKIVNTVTLTMAVDGPDYSASSTNPGEGDHVVPAGAWTDIEAFPAEGWFFDKWTLEGDADIVDVFARETYVSLNANATVTANFKPIESTAKLTLAISPDASGSTNPSPGEQTVIVGEHIEIEAIPADGYSFENWTVSGGATVTGSAESGWLATLTADGTVTANFMPENGAWVNITGNVPGANRPVYAFNGDTAGNVYVGGLFSVVGRLSTNAVAKLSLATGEWSDLGGGMKNNFSVPPDVKTFARDAAGNLYIGGSFRIPGDEILSPCDIAKWDGRRWTRILSMPTGQSIRALACDSSGNLYAGGTFNMVDGEPANNIAKWDGKRWSALGDGADDDVNALSCDAKGNLYIAGDFENVDGIPANKVAVWDGSKWSALGSGVSGVRVNVIKCDNEGKLYVGGNFSGAGAVMAQGVAVWNGSKWSGLGSGLDKGSIIYALDMDASGKVYVAGSIAQEGQKTVKDVAVWNGTSWSVLGAEANDRINTLIVTGNDTLLIGGGFSVIGGLPAQSIAKWDSSGWHTIGVGTNGGCNASAYDSKGNLYFGGEFTAVNGINANHVAKWTGTNWSALGPGLNGTVEALAVDANGKLFAGGYFTTAGEIDAAHVAVWNGSAWAPLGKGVDGYVLCLAFDSAGNLYVGGRFRKAGDTEANCIAKWDGTTWTALGQGTDMDVTGITCAADGKVYVAGGFNKAGGVDAKHVAVWDGSVWAPLGAGFLENPHFKYCIVSDAKNNIYVGGGFPATMDQLKVNCIAMWDGSKWNALAAGIDNGGVDSLVFDVLGRLCVGGDFTSVSGVKASKLAVWDGEKWLNPFAAGLDNAVFSILPSPNGDLYAGGYQSMAGGLISPYISKWNHSATSHTLTVSSGSGSGSYSAGASVKIEAAHIDGQVFDKWTGDVAYVKDVSASFTTVAIPAKDISVTASYRTGMYHDVYFNAGNGGSLEGGVKQIKQTVIPGGSCAPILAVPDDGYLFAGWTGSITSNENPLVVTNVTEELSITANFVQSGSTATLTMAADPVEGGSTLPSLGEHAGTPVGKPVPIRATVADGYFFNGWITSEKAIVANQYDEATVVILSGDATVTATFSRIVLTATLTMSANPWEGGTTEPAIGVHVARPIGQTFPIKAIPEAGYLFAGWSAGGGAQVAFETAPETTATLSADGTITANFMKLVSTATLTMAVSPSAGGSVTPATGEHGGTPVGIPFNVAAVASTGYLFTGWSVSENVSVVDPGMDSTEAILFGDATLTANFAPVVTTATLTLAVSPENSGSTNPVIGTHVVAVGDTVEIGAVPASGYVFEKWISVGSAKIKDPYEPNTSVIIYGDTTFTATFAKLTGEWVWEENALTDSLKASHKKVAISGDGKTLFVGGWHANLLVSKDAGASWLSIYPPGGDWTSMSCSEDARVVIGTFIPGTIQMTTDGGATWSANAPEENPNDWTSSAVSSDGSIIYIGHSRGDVYKKVGTGEWTKLDLPHPEDSTCAVLRCSADGRTVLAGQFEGMLMLSKDAGATWSLVDLTGGKTGKWVEGWMSADGKTILVSEETGPLNASFDAGLTWQKFFVELPNLQITGLSGAEDASLLVVSTDQGVYIHNAGGTDFSWTKVDSLGDFYGNVACSKTAKMIFLGSASNALPCLSRNYGADWINMDFGNDWLSAASSADGGCQIVSGQDHIMYSNDQGGVWKDVKPAGGGWPYCSISADGNKLSSVVSNGSLYVSADAGSNWTECTELEPNKYWGGLAMTPKAEVIFAAGCPDFISKSKDFGATWQTLYPVDEETELYWRAIACDSTGEKILAAAFKESIYQSLDGGTTWKELDVGGGAILEWSGACSSADGKVLAVTARKDKLYISRDGGENWTACSPTGETGDWFGVSCSDDGKVIAATNLNDRRFYISRDSGVTWKDQTAYAVKYTTPFVSANGRWTGAGASGGKYYFAELVDSSFDVTIAMEGEGSMYPAAGQYWKKPGQKTVLNAFPLDNGYYFSSWSVSGGAVVDEPFHQETTVTFSGDARVTANFAKIGSTAKLTLDITPDNSGSTNPVPGTHIVPIGAHTEIEATASAGYYFEKWISSGGAEIEDPYNAKTSLVLSGDGMVIANFAKATRTASLTLAVTPGSSGSTNPGTGIHKVAIGAHTQIEAIPVDGYGFVKWTSTGGAKVNDPDSEKTSVVISGNAKVTANFEVVKANLYMTSVGNGTTNPAGRSYVNTYTPIAIKAIPGIGYKFDGWTVSGGAEVADVSLPETAATLTADGTVTANFARNQGTLFVGRVGNGQTIPASGGTVETNVPQAIEAIETDADFTFANWTISGTGTLENPRSANTNVTLNGQEGCSATVTANFFDVHNSLSGGEAKNLSGIIGSSSLYRINIPDGITRMLVTTSATGATLPGDDCDLYVRPVMAPSTGGYYAKSTNVGTDEEITVLNPAVGDWYILVYGYDKFTGIELTATLFRDVPGIPTNLTGTTSGLEITLNWNASTEEPLATSYDIYRSKDNAPELAEFIKNTDALTTVDTKAVAGTHYYYWVKARKGDQSSGFSEYAQGWLADSAATELRSGVVKTAISGAAGSTRHYTIKVPEDQVLLEIKAYGGTGDCDLTVTNTKDGIAKYGVKTTNNETVLIENPLPVGVYEIALYANTAYSGMSLVATYYSGKPHPPTDVAASRGTYPDTIRVSWTASAGATSYEIWRGATANRNVSAKIGEISDISYMDTFDLAVGQTYYYWINGKNPAGASAFSAAASGYVSHVPAAVASVSASNGTYFDKIEVAWPKTIGATSYELYRSSAAIPLAMRCISFEDYLYRGPMHVAVIDYDSRLSTYSYSDMNADGRGIIPGNTYIYWVAAVNGNGASPLKPSSTVGSLKKTGPGGVLASNGTYAGKVKITWNAVAGATGYNVYRETPATKVTPNPKPSPINEVPVAGTVYYDATAVPGTAYTYWVDADYNRLYKSSLSHGSNGKVSDAHITALAAPVMKSVSKGEGAFVKLTWGEVPLALSYNVYWKINAADQWVLLKNGITECTYTNLTASAGQTFMYCVKAVNGLTYSAFSASMSGYAAGALAAPVIEVDRFTALNLSGGVGNQKVYQIAVPSGISRLVAKGEGMTGSCDLYAKFGMYPTTTSYNAKGTSINGTADRILTVTNPAEGAWYVLLYGTGTSGYSYANLSIDYYSSSDIIFTQVPANNLSVPFTAAFKGRVLDRARKGISGLHLQVRDPITGLETWLASKTDANGCFTYSTVIHGEGEYTYDFFFTSIPDYTQSIGSWTVKTKKSAGGIFDFSGYLTGSQVKLFQDGGATSLGAMQEYMNVRRGFSYGPASTFAEDFWVENTLGVVHSDPNITPKLDSGLYFLLYGTEGAAVGNGLEANPGLAASPLLVHVAVDSQTSVLNDLKLINVIGNDLADNVAAGGIGVVVLTAVNNPAEDPETGLGYDISLYADQQLELLANLAGNVPGKVTVVEGGDKKYAGNITRLVDIKIDGVTRTIGVRAGSFFKKITEKQAE